ncbi:hypothetical protein AB0B89_35805 [Sphaerisporangium sp. NPDC049002]|uniref:hypothetical protein n=1 Tax=Sphaerisporangium sp. NPDC049002 TaxID=3155392 RepID=UPI0034025A9C
MSGTIPAPVAPSFGDYLAGSGNETLLHAYAYGLSVGELPGRFTDHDAVTVLAAGLREGGPWSLQAVMVSLRQELRVRGLNVWGVIPSDGPAEAPSVAAARVPATTTMTEAVLHQVLEVAGLKGSLQVVESAPGADGRERVRVASTRSDSCVVALRVVHALRVVLGDLGNEVAARLMVKATQGGCMVFLRGVALVEA